MDRSKYALALVLVATLGVGHAEAQDRTNNGGFRGGGGGPGFGIGLGVGLGAAALAGILATQGRDGPRNPEDTDRPIIRTRPRLDVPVTGPGDQPPRRFHPKKVRTTTNVDQPPARTTTKKPPVRVTVNTPAPPAAAVAPPPLLGPIVPPPSTETRYVPDEILVVTNSAAPAALQRFESRFGLTPLASARIALLDADIRRYRIRSGATVPTTLASLRGQGVVLGAEPNYLFALQDDPAKPSDAKPDDRTPDTTANEAPASDAPVQYAVKALKLDAAHKLAMGDGVLIAVIDSGVDEKNAELQGTVADRFDALGGTFAAQAHGTAMAGAIVAHRTLVGVAPKARLMAIRAFGGAGQVADGTGFDVLRGLDYAALHGAKIVNMSFAGPRDLLFEKALTKAYGRGIVALAAAGNGGPTAAPLYPAAGPNVIAITATDADGKPFEKANRGSYVAVAAPGVDVVAPGLGEGVQLSSGTSIATAEASGVAALILQKNPKATPDAVRRILTSTAAHLDSDSNAVGAGQIDAAAAVTTGN